MSTHGNILIYNADPENDGKVRIWLHAYHTGHAHEAFNRLKTLPEYFVRAMVRELENRVRCTQDESLPYDILGAGALTVQMLISRDRNETPESLRDSWRYNLGVNIDYCDASMVAGQLICCTAGRWNVIDESDAPWHAVGDLPDLTVVCYPNQGIYKIIPSDEYKDPEEDEEYRLEDAQVNWAKDVYAGFEREVLSGKHSIPNPKETEKTEDDFISEDAAGGVA